jgi:lactoylglutathione lyase
MESKAASTACCASSTAAPMSEPKVHIHLHAAELQRSIDFYRTFFGEEPIKRFADYAKFLPSWAPVNLALSAGKSAERGAVVGHFGIQLAHRELVQAHLLRIKAAGLPARVEMNVDCCHANQDKFWVQDPSGVEWELYYLNHDLEAPAGNASASACCAR